MHSLYEPVQKPLIIVYFGASRRTRCLKVVWSLLRHSYFVYARCKNPGKAMRMHSWNVGAFPTGQRKKNKHLVC